MDNNKIVKQKGKENKWQSNPVIRVRVETKLIKVKRNNKILIMKERKKDGKVTKVIKPEKEKRMTEERK